MALTNPQYDAIMRMYNERQLRHQREQQEHIRIAYEKIPRLAEIDAEIASLSVRKAKAMLNGDASMDLDLNAAIRDRSQERAALLSMHGYPADYLELTYDCPLCRDTGYINGTQKCACFKKAAVDLLYRQSNVEELLKAENFSQFSLDYYSDSLTSTGTPLTSREAAAAALEKSQAFVRNFGSSFENLFFYGDTGVGKTFLSHCIARELIEQSFCVIYFTAFDLFDLFARYTFSSSEEAKDAHANIFDCDLLIIDDLGTELTNSFVSSQLFLCINERILRKKSTIISTNLPLDRFMETYSERTFSRISSNYTIIKLFGNDIRIQKTFGRNQSMSKGTEGHFDTLPIGRLGLIPLNSSAALGKKVDDYLVSWRKGRGNEFAEKYVAAYEGYERDSYIIQSQVPRFGSGEAKGIINESVRGDDIYILLDVCNYSLTYSLCGYTNHMSPDDHFQDLKRVIAAIGGKARRINVIMPFLYESRQHKRSGRESLDCALGLQELTAMGVENIITFDAHDPRVQNAIPLHGFETIQPAYQFIKNILRNAPDMKLDKDHLMVISPDEGGMGRAIYMANNLGVDMGMFYKRRDYSTIIDGRNPIVAHEFLGADVKGKDMIIIDDMISSGESMLEVAKLLKDREARNIYMCSTFGLFTSGLEKFDKAYEEGLFTKVLTTNVVYQTPELLSREYYISCDLSKYIALIIDKLNHDASISGLLDPADRIQKVIKKFKNHEKI